MKRYFLLFMLLFLSYGKNYAQYTDVIVKEMPVFTYYDEEEKREVTIPIKKFIDKWVKQRYDYFAEAEKKRETGLIYIKFFINTDGDFVLKEVTAPYPSLQQGARKVFEGVPKFTPAKDQNGKPIEVHFTYPINYILEL